MPHPPEAATPLSLADVSALIADHFPQVGPGGKLILIEHVGDRAARLRLPHALEHLRPGGTVSGPSMVMLADVAIYVAILATLGEGALQAVTTSLNINFLKRPAPGELVAVVKLIKVGRRLAVGECSIFDADESEMLAHATATYALPADIR
ncbi:MAG: PaaI family thioesterase [Hyphomicrobiaceae bacterium]|nr:PaaI family thioesterase [Hyphomicrobiaceae bacterium]